MQIANKLDKLFLNPFFFIRKIAKKINGIIIEIPLMDFTLAYNPKEIEHNKTENKVCLTKKRIQEAINKIINEMLRDSALIKPST
jgi:hypothetical protein